MFVPSGTRITVFANSDLWLRSALEDEDEESTTINKNVLIDPNKDDERNLIKNEETGSSSGTGSADPNAQTMPANPNDPNNLQQQQQIYYNNYAGQQQQQRPRQPQLIDPNKNKPQPPTVVQPVVVEKPKEPEDPVPELF